MKNRVSSQVVLRKALTYSNPLGYGFLCKNFAMGRLWQLVIKECHGMKKKKGFWPNDLKLNSKCVLRGDAVNSWPISGTHFQGFPEMHTIPVLICRNVLSLILSIRRRKKKSIFRKLEFSRTGETSEVITDEGKYFFRARPWFRNRAVFCPMPSHHLHPMLSGHFLKDHFYKWSLLLDFLPMCTYVDLWNDLIKDS